MDPLTQQMMQRAMAPQGGQGQPPMPDLATLLQPPPGATGQLPSMPGVNGQPPLPQSGAPAPYPGIQPPDPMSGPAPNAPGPVPATPPNPQAHIPQQAQRFDNAQQLMDSYRNGWSPNPMLLRASQTK